MTINSQILKFSNIKYQINNFKNILDNWLIGLFDYSPQSGAGFTLVELLVVIGIITLLMVTIFPNFTGARQRARDSQRKTDLKNIQTALDLYKLDQKPPVYPSTGALGSTLCGKCWSSDADCGVSGGNVYIKKVPCDYSGTSPTPYAFVQNPSDNLRYTLSACLENPVDPDKDTGPQLGGCAVSYTVSEP